MLHIVKKRISGRDHLNPGETVDTSDWPNVDRLVRAKYLEPAPPPNENRRRLGKTERD